MNLVRTDEPGSDLALMADFAARQERAAGVLYDRFASRIYGLGVVMLGNHQSAQDLVQDTFVKVWRTARSYDPSRGSLDTWVLLIARSLAIDLIRRRVIEARTLASQEDPEAAIEPSPEDTVETHDLVGRARAAMATLTPGQRAALELAYFQGKTSAEVAELEGIPVGTAKTRIRTALAKIREVLEVEHEL